MHMHRHRGLREPWIATGLEAAGTAGPPPPPPPRPTRAPDSLLLRFACCCEPCSVGSPQLSQGRCCRPAAAGAASAGGGRAAEAISSSKLQRGEQGSHMFSSGLASEPHVHPLPMRPKPIGQISH